MLLGNVLYKFCHKKCCSIWNLLRLHFYVSFKLEVRKKQLNSFDVFRVSFVGIFCKETKEKTFPENKFETAKLSLVCTFGKKYSFIESCMKKLKLRKSLSCKLFSNKIPTWSKHFLVIEAAFLNSFSRFF